MCGAHYNTVMVLTQVDLRVYQKGRYFQAVHNRNKGAIIPKVSQLMTSTSATEVWYHIYTSKVK